MQLQSIWKFESKGLFFFTLFYLIASMANFLILGIYDLGFYHIALVAVLSLITSIGLFQQRSWSLWFVVGLFFIATTYAAFMLNAFVARYTASPAFTTLLAILAYAIYLILTWIATIYVAAKRQALK
jgi:hypothetical protein